MIPELSLTLQAIPHADDGVVRLDQADMRLLGIMAGDIVAIEGVRTCYARALPAYLEDRNQRILRASALLIENLGTPEGQNVKVLAERQRPEIAESLTLEVEDDIDHLHLLAQKKLLIGFWHDRPIVAHDRLCVPTLGTYPLFAKVLTSQPEGLVRVVPETVFHVVCRKPSKGFPRIGGMREVYRSCQTIAEARLIQKRAMSAKSVLLYGPLGSGKRRMILRLAQEMGLYLTTLDAREFLDRQILFSDHDIGFSLTETERRGMGLIFLDHLEVLRSDEKDALPLLQAKRRVAASFTALLQDMELHPNLILFADLSGNHGVDLLPSENFDLKLPIEAPDRHARREILLLETEKLSLAPDVDLDNLAAQTSGCTMQDLHRLVTATAMAAPSEDVAQKDFLHALRNIEPSAKAEVFCEVPDVLWEDLAGLDDVKNLLKETLEWSLRHQAQFSSFGIKPPRSILLSGGPGTGKTSLARALANMAPTHFIEIPCPLLVSNDIAGARRLLRESFALAKRKMPCLIFLDDIDVLFEALGRDEGLSSSHPLVAQLLVELDHVNLSEGVVVIAATNRPDRLTTDMMRPGRLDYAITLPMPDSAARKKILQIHARKLPLSADVDFDLLAQETQALSPADIANLCNRAGLIALRQSLNSPDGGVIPPVVNAALFEQILRGKKN